jgi:hypothetical protein
MAIATYKDLCIDAVDPVLLGTFWAAALGLELHRLDDGDVRLTGPTEGHTVWVNRVPEPRTVKHRVHLDVNTPSVAELTAAGARVLDDHSFGWTVMADPEDGEFCAFVREEPVTERLYLVGVDTVDDPAHALRIATWWADVLGAQARDSGRGYSAVEHVPGAPFEAIVFAPVPEPKTVKNRLHLDVTTPDLDELVAAGASVLRPRHAARGDGSGDGIGWTVLADPDGNEFCGFTA